MCSTAGSGGQVGVRWGGAWLLALVSTVTLHGSRQALADFRHVGHVRHDPPSARWIGVSDRLGLAEVAVSGLPPDSEGVLVVESHLGGPMRIPLVPAPGWSDEPAGHTPALRARLSGLGASARWHVEWSGPGGAGRLGPFESIPAPDPAHRTPDWAKGMVWYQIMPERYRNGEPGNDPRHPDSKLLAWNSPWGRVSVDEVESAWAMAEAGEGNAGRLVSRSGAWSNVIFQRRFGGDLQGVIQRLDELHDLGVEGIYLTPIFRAPSLHKYDAADFRHIDDAFAGPPGAGTPRWHEPGETEDPATWTWTPADRWFVDQFLPAVHSRRMRLVLDGVWNHTGTRFWAFEDLVRSGSGSPFASWFDAVLATGRETVAGQRPFRPGQLIGWRGWDRRNGGLPAFRQIDGDLAPPVKRHVMAVTERWMRPRSADGTPVRGCDGWRLDVAPDLGLPFWRDWRAHVKAIDPEALLIGEIWFPARDYFAGAAFDGQMNYPVAEPVVRWLSDRRYAAGALATALGRAAVNHPATELVQFNLLDSHDTARLVTMIDRPAEAYDGAAARRGVFGRPGPEAYDRAVLGVAFLAAYQGSPMIYYGTEWGMHGGDDPDNRRPVPWPDAGPYDSPDASLMPQIRDRMRAWIRLRLDARLGPLLRFGLVQFFDSGNPDVLLFARRLDDRAVLIALNRGDTPLAIDPASLPADLRPPRDDRTIAPRDGRFWIAESPGAR